MNWPKSHPASLISSPLRRDAGRDGSSMSPDLGRLQLRRAVLVTGVSGGSGSAGRGSCPTAWRKRRGRGFRPRTGTRRKQGAEN